MSVLEPLEHSVPDETLLGLDPLEHSGLDQAGHVGRHFAGGPVGPDETLLGLDPLEHSGLDRADPAGQHTAVGPVGLFVARMLQGALLAQMISFKFWIR